MSRNGTGTYNLPAGNPVVTGTTISTTWANTTLTDIATALTGSVAADGQTPITGSLNLNSNTIVNLANPSANQDAATKVYVDTADGLALLKASNLSDVANATTSRTNLSAAKSGANSDITSITGLTTALTASQGGTGAATLTANAVLLGNGTSAIQTVAPSTSGNVLTSNGTTWISAVPASYPLTSGTAVASTSGTSITFTGIPSWAKRVTVMFNGVSTTGTANYLVRIGSGSLQTTGYTSTAAYFTTGPSTQSVTNGFLIRTDNAGNNICGAMVICNFSGNDWIESWAGGGSAINQCYLGGGAVSLSGALDRVSILTENGSDTFDAGSINILYE